MANKTVQGYTQVPVVAKDLQEIHYRRLNPTGTANQLTVVYDTCDDSGVVRVTKTHSQQVAGYPITAASILSAINAVEGT